MACSQTALLFLCVSKEEVTKKKTHPGAWPSLAGWVPCASHHFGVAAIDILSCAALRAVHGATPPKWLRCSATQWDQRSKARDKVANPVCAPRTLFNAFCVAEHRRDCEVERQGCRESLAGPWMAHQGGPLNPEKHRATAAGRPRIRLYFFLVPSFFGFGSRRRSTSPIHGVVATQKR